VAVNSRAKGRAFEQLIARDLRAQLGPSWVVMRNQTDRQRGQQGAAGEFAIERVDPSSGPGFRWCLECKAHKAFSEGMLWRSEVPALVVGWWRQAVRQAESIGRAPVLVMRRPHGEILAVVREAEHLYSPPPRAVVRLDGDDVLVMRWDAWLATLA
jgi:hypothetical protein